MMRQIGERWNNAQVYCIQELCWVKCDKWVETKNRQEWRLVWHPHADSNCALQLRRLTLCPLSYGGNGRNFTIARIALLAIETFFAIPKEKLVKHFGCSHCGIKKLSEELKKLTEKIGILIKEVRNAIACA